MSKNYYLAIAVLGLIITTAVVGISTFAQTTADQTTKPNFIAKHQELKQAITDGDYETWAELMHQKVEDLRTQATKLESQINQDTFDQLTTAHELMQQGNVEEASAIFKELGPPGPGPLGHRGMMGKASRPGFKFGQESVQSEN